MPMVEVVNYDPAWPAVFKQLKARVWPAVSDVAVRIEHVGSTAVAGLSAKPVIDMTIVVGTSEQMPMLVERLATIGYRHRGDLGVSGREAFARPPDTPPHHLYACVEGNLALRNHLAIRDSLRRDPAKAQAYGLLKRQLAARFPDDIDAYIEGKTQFLLDILAETGLAPSELDAIRAINANNG